MKKRPETVPHPLFHSLVIMGGSAAVACGGVASGQGGTGAGDPSTGGGGSGGNAGTGGSPGAGGTFEIGGATASGGSGGVMVFPCPEAQYTCNETQAQQLACNFSPLDPGGCTCDSTRPTSEAQCGPSELFACRMVQAYDPDAGAYAAKYVFDVTV